MKKLLIAAMAATTITINATAADLTPHDLTGMWQVMATPTVNNTCASNVEVKAQNYIWNVTAYPGGRASDYIGTFEIEVMSDTLFKNYSGTIDSEGQRATANGITGNNWSKNASAFIDIFLTGYETKKEFFGHRFAISSTKNKDNSAAPCMVQYLLEGKKI